MDDLMQKVYAYNRSLIQQERKAKKVEEIKAILDRLSRLPTPTELFEFLKKIREVLQDD